MVSLIYVSAATRLLNEEQLAVLLAQAREKNARLGVTGLLLYKDGDFMQVLEGEAEVVDRLMETIRRDPRHHDVIRILEQPIEKRSFGDWTMGFRIVRNADLKKDPAFNEFLEGRFIDEGRVDATLALKLLTSFRDS